MVMEVSATVVEAGMVMAVKVAVMVMEVVACHTAVHRS
jgi:hypothetical protein